MGLQHGAGKGKTEVLGDIGHGRNEQGRIVYRDLHALQNRGFRATAIGVVKAHHIREKEGIEAALFQDLRQLHPRIKLCVLKLACIVTHPQAVLNVRDAIHVKGV